MSYLDDHLKVVMDNSLVSSASKFYQAATSNGPPIIYGKLKNWLLDEEMYTSADIDHCGCSTILKKVGMSNKLGKIFVVFRAIEA